MLGSVEVHGHAVGDRLRLLGAKHTTIIVPN